MIKMDQFCDNLARLLQNPENYLRPNESLYKSWVDQTALSYNGLKTEENFYGLPASGEALPELYTDGLDMEQVWQQVELQNNILLAAPDDLTSLDDINLPYCVVKLNSRVKYDSMNNNIEDGETHGKTGKDDPASEMEEEDDVEKDDENVEDEKMDDEEGDEMDEDEEDDFGMDLDGKKKKLQDSLLNGDEFEDLDSSDFDEDHYDDLAQEGQEDEDDDDDVEDDDIEEDDHHKDNKKQRINEEDDDDDEYGINALKKSLEKDKNKMDILKKPDKFKSTEVDDVFFKLRESEWVADNDILGAELEGNFDDIDFFEDLTDEEEDASAAMYNTFFDSIDKKKNRTKKNDEETNNPIEKDNLNSEDNTNKDEDKKNKEESDDDEDIDEGVPKLLGGNKKEKKSTFEREQEKERQIIESLEEETMTEKPWFLKGEVQSRDRPENSTLEEHLDYEIAAKQRPVITEDTTALVEKLILNRIRTQAFDDVERKVKPEANPFEYKKKLLIDQEKSKKSLAEIYEEEYIKKQKEEEDDDEEPKAHTEIKSMMDHLFVKLDALANYHYMPKHRKAEVKIVSNLPAVTMEEASPATATDASLLAPQEVLAPVRGELRTAGERTTTDKKRERRQKKSKQKARAKEEERKLSEKLKKVGGSDGKKLDAKSSAKVVQKAVKAGQVKMLSDNHSNKHIKSSQTFFKQLQDDVSSQIKKKKDQSIENKKKKKEIGQTTASKIML